jgi:hypothetical protein
MSRQFTALTFAWLYQVNSDTSLAASDVCVCVQLTAHFNEERGGVAWPGYRTIGKPIGLSDATVMRSIRRLEVAGHLRVQRGSPGKGHSNHYWMLVKASPVKYSKASSAEANTSSVTPKASPVKQNHSNNHPKNHPKNHGGEPPVRFADRERLPGDEWVASVARRYARRGRA